MELSVRLEKIASVVEKCEAVCDIGTDHGYIPIYLVNNGTCSCAIASDINRGPVKKAKLNVSLEGLEKKIDCRLGPGFSTIKPFEVQCAIIAGMGGNLIRDIIMEGMEVFKSLRYAVLSLFRMLKCLENLYAAADLKLLMKNFVGMTIDFMK